MSRTWPRAEIQRRMFNHMTPSGFSWLQPMFPPVVPFDAGYFDESFLDGLLGEDTNSVAVYPLSLVLDPKTRETLIYNAEGELIATVPADGVPRTWPEDADPARVTLQLDLLPSEDVEPYLYVEDRVAESLATVASKSAKTPKTGGVVIMNMMVSSTNFGILSFQRLTNGNMQLTVTNGTDVAEVYSYTVWHTSSVDVVTWTNEQSNVVTDTNTLWTPVSPTFNGLENTWDCQTTNLVLTNGGGIWEDSNISSNARVRFYGVAKRADADHDGLTDGAELFVHHTSPTNRDTDADGWSDAEELVEETDPLDRFSATHLAKGVFINALCYNPSNGLASSNQWIQLHSSSASAVNLSDFHLQVAGSNYATKLSFPSNTWIQPGHFILLGGFNVVESDFHTDLNLPNSYSTIPTSGARLVGPDGVEANPADVVMYGTHTPFNDGGLPTNGWSSTNTDLWAGKSNELVRTRLGQDNDLRSDWTYQLVGDLWNSEIVLDSDGDGLTDGEEYSGSTANGVQSDPFDPDTDNDGLEDGFEADHGLNPANSDSDGDSTLDPDEINPETGNTYLDDQLGTDVSVTIDASLPGWILGQSIGSNGWVKFTLTGWDGVGVWATIKEGGDEPEDFTCTITNATVAYSNDIINGGFRTLQLLLISTNHAVPIEITVNDGGTYWTDQTPITLGPDIFAHFDAVKVNMLSDNAVNSPKLFEFGETNPNPPCGNAPEQAESLNVYFSDVFDYVSHEVDDYDVILRVSPTSLNIASWSKHDGPLSGSLINSDKSEAIYRNPKLGGLYQFDAMVQSVETRTQLLLPMGGPDVTDYFLSECQRYDTWLSTMKARVWTTTTNDFSRGFAVSMYFTKTAWNMNHKKQDFQAGVSPCEDYCDDTVTICDYVFGRDHVANFLYAYLAARTGFNFETTQLGGKLAALAAKKVSDNPDDQAAYAAGYAFGQNPSTGFKDILEENNIYAMQNDVARRGWPSTDIDSGLEYPTWGASQSGLDNPD